jgi:hypothetical protein
VLLATVLALDVHMRAGALDASRTIKQRNDTADILSSRLHTAVACAMSDKTEYTSVLCMATTSTLQKCIVASLSLTLHT